jgi:hypothetical protein
VNQSVKKDNTAMTTAKTIMFEPDLLPAVVPLELPAT